MERSFYDVLGVAPDADEETVVRAFRQKAKAHHPDVSDEDNARAIFKRLKTAKEALTDETARARYDRLGHETYVREHVDGNGWGVTQDVGTATSSASTAARQYVEQQATARREPTASASTRSQQTRGGTTAYGTATDYYTPGQRVNPTVTATSNWSLGSMVRDVGPLILGHVLFFVSAIAMAIILTTGGALGQPSSVATIALAGSMILITVFVSVMHMISRLS